MFTEKSDHNENTWGELYTKRRMLIIAINLPHSGCATSRNDEVAVKLDNYIYNKHHRRVC